MGTNQNQIFHLEKSAYQPGWARFAVSNKFDESFTDYILQAFNGATSLPPNGEPGPNWLIRIFRKMKKMNYIGSNHRLTISA